MQTLLPIKKATPDDSLLIYGELDSAAIRTVQRRLKAGELQRIAPGLVSSMAPEAWPSLIARERIRVLASLFPGAIVGFRSAFFGGTPQDGVIHLNYSYNRATNLPGLKVVLIKGSPNLSGDAHMMGRNLFFPSLPRLLLENLAPSRGTLPKAVGRLAVEERLLSICDARGEDALSRLREEAKELAQPLALESEFFVLDEIVGSILGTRESRLQSATGKARTAAIPYDAERLALLEKLAARLRDTPLIQPVSVTSTEAARANFAFLESYFSNFIEGTEFDVQDARAFVLDGKAIEVRPKDSHDVLGVFRQAIDRGWSNQTLAVGEGVLMQLRTRHADQMRERPEVGPGEFKVKSNRAGNTEFVDPKLVRGTLVEGSQLLPSVPEGTARALLAMFLISEVHPFADGNGRLARLVMNAELSVMNSCRIIVPTLFREEYLDCLRVLTRDGNPEPFLTAMQKIHHWSSAFSYENLDDVIATMKACNAFERSLVQFKLLFP